MSPRNARRVTVFVGAAGLLGEPLFDVMICRFSASIDGEMLETTASSALDRGFMSCVFSITGRGQQCVELVVDVNNGHTHFLLV